MVEPINRNPELLSESLRQDGSSSVRVFPAHLPAAPAGRQVYTRIHLTQLPLLLSCKSCNPVILVQSLLLSCKSYNPENPGSKKIRVYMHTRIHLTQPPFSYPENPNCLNQDCQDYRICRIRVCISIFLSKKYPFIL